MTTLFHPHLFDAIAFRNSSHTDIYERIIAGLFREDPYGWEIDGYDIISVRVINNPQSSHDTYEYIGSIVDFLLQKLPMETANFAQISTIIELLAKLTQQMGNLSQLTAGKFFGYLTQSEVQQLYQLLTACPIQIPWSETTPVEYRTNQEKLAMQKILAIACSYHTGLMYSVS